MKNYISIIVRRSSLSANRLTFQLFAGKPETALRGMGGELPSYRKSKSRGFIEPLSLSAAAAAAGERRSPHEIVKRPFTGGGGGSQGRKKGSSQPATLPAAHAPCQGQR